MNKKQLIAIWPCPAITEFCAQTQRRADFEAVEAWQRANSMIPQRITPEQHRAYVEQAKSIFNGKESGHV